MSVDIISQNMQASSRALLDYWLKIRGSELVPHRSDLRPGEIASLLPHMVILEFRAPDKLIYRLTGTEIVQRLGYDLTGDDLYEVAIPSEVFSARYKYNAMRAQPCGLIVTLLLHSRFNVAFAAELIFLPLKDRDGAITQLVGVVCEIKDGDKIKSPGDLASMTALRTMFLDIGAGVPNKQQIALQAAG